MATKNDVNRLFAETMEYAKTAAIQSAVTAVQSNSKQSSLLVNVEKAIKTAMTTAYNNSALAMQKKLDEFEKTVVEKTAADATAKAQTSVSQKKTVGRRSSQNKTA